MSSTSGCTVAIPGKTTKVSLIFILIFTGLEFPLISVFYRASDLYMKGFQNAKERDATDCAQLFESVDSRLKILEIKSRKGSFLSLVCAVWEGEDTF